jgi:hypothetical protein
MKPLRTLYQPTQTKRVHVIIEFVLILCMALLLLCLMSL